MDDTRGAPRPLGNILTFYFYDAKEFPDGPPALKDMYPVTLRGLDEEEVETFVSVLRGNGAKMIVHGEVTDRNAVAEAYANAVMESMVAIRRSGALG
jgi:hypothetical protein